MKDCGDQADLIAQDPAIRSQGHEHGHTNGHPEDQVADCDVLYDEDGHGIQVYPSAAQGIEDGGVAGKIEEDGEKDPGEEDPPLSPSDQRSIFLHRTHALSQTNGTVLILLAFIGG